MLLRTAKPAWLPAVLWLSVLCPAEAHAHSAFQGAGDVLNGLLHPFTTPAHLLLLLGLGMLLGRQAPLRLRLPMIWFGCAAAGGLLASTTGGAPAFATPLILALALVTAGCLASARVPGRTGETLLLTLAGAMLGLDSGLEAGGWATRVKTLGSTWLMLVVLVCDVAFYVSLGGPRRWLQVGVRILGSWIMAIAFLVLAFTLRK